MITELPHQDVDLFIHTTDLLTNVLHGVWCPSVILILVLYIIFLHSFLLPFRSSNDFEGFFCVFFDAVRSLFGLQTFSYNFQSLVPRVGALKPVLRAQEQGVKKEEENPPDSRTPIPDSVNVNEEALILT